MRQRSHDLFINWMRYIEQYVSSTWRKRKNGNWQVRRREVYWRLDFRIGEILAGHLRRVMIQGLKRVAYRNDEENPHSYLSKESHATNWVVKRKTNGGGEEDAACWGGCPWRGWQNKPPSVFLVLIERLEFCISSTMDTWASHRRRASCPSYKLSYQVVSTTGAIRSSRRRE